MGQFFHTKNEKKYFEKKINERFGECSFFYVKRPINVESHMYKITNKDGTHFSRYLFSCCPCIAVYLVATIMYLVTAAHSCQANL